MALLTVFTPAYNRASTLPRTYQSLCEQECKDFIWLIVDDGSSDNTRELVEDWKNQDNRFEIQYIYKKKSDMWRFLEKFVEYFDDIYGDRDEKFLEADGRRYFMLFLKPIINGTGNYYIEARTRNDEQTDMIIDYLGQQYIIEMKIWHGNAYNERGVKQLSDYLEYYHVDKGYMLSFNFNKNKKIGVKEVVLGEKLLIEAVV